MRRLRLISILMAVIMVVSSAVVTAAEVDEQTPISDKSKLPAEEQQPGGKDSASETIADQVVNGVPETEGDEGAEDNDSAADDAVESNFTEDQSNNESASDEQQDVSAEEATVEATAYEALDTVPLSGVSALKDTDGVLLRWSKVYDEAGNAAKGYVILARRGVGAWKLVKTSSGKPYSTSFLYYRDGSPSKGVNKYVIAPYYSTAFYNKIAAGQYEIGDAVNNNAISYYWMSQPAGLGVSKSGTSLKASWTMPAGNTVDGFVFQRAMTPVFNGAVTTKTAADDRSVSIRLNSASGKRYCRVRAYKVYRGRTYYSEWKTSLGANYSETLSKSAYTFNGCTNNLYPAAGQSYRVTGYSVMQGGAADGTYLYYVMENQQKGRVKIAKVKISTGKVVKVSPALDLDHANSMCYNSTSKTLVVVHNQTHMRRLSVIDAGTLKIKKRVDVDFPAKIFATGCHASTAGERISTTNGMIAISYIKSRNQYAVQTKGVYSEIVMLDANFKPLYMITLSSKKSDSYYYQDIAMTGDYILISQSGNKNKKYTDVSCDNFVAVFDYNGEYQGKITVNKKYEVENISIAGGKIYTGFHTSTMARQYTWKYYKKVAKTAANRRKYSVPDKYKVVVSGNKYKVYKAKSVGNKVRCRYGKVYKS